MLWLPQLDGGAAGLPSPLQLISPASAVRVGFPRLVTTRTTATATNSTTPMPNADTGRMVNRGLDVRPPPPPPPSSPRVAGHGASRASARSSAAMGEGAGGENSSAIRMAADGYVALDERAVIVNGVREIRGSSATQRACVYRYSYRGCTKNCTFLEQQSKVRKPSESTGL